jgi:uncharacterized membrane protein
MLDIPNLDDIKKVFKNPTDTHRSKMTSTDKLAVWITNKVGTMGFFFVIFVWTVAWFAWNIFAPVESQFDPFPAFVMWLFISNMIQIFLMPLIMIGQNLQGRYSEIRAQSDYEINLKAEQEIQSIMKHLEKQDDLIKKILEKVDNK